MPARLRLALIALVLAACSGGTGGSTTETPGTTTVPPTSAASSTVSPSTEATTAPPPGGGSITEGPAAPDFTLELGTGGTYTLSEGSKPVFLVFWAEW